MTQFLILYDQARGKLLDLVEFADEEREAALERRFELERQHHRDSNIEVVVLGAATRADLERTHGRYFKSVAQLADET
jgi:hypothetical protein